MYDPIQSHLIPGGMPRHSTSNLALCPGLDTLHLTPGFTNSTATLIRATANSEALSKLIDYSRHLFAVRIRKHVEP
jgi:hypothetical protein